MPKISKSTPASRSLLDPLGSVKYVTTHISTAESFQSTNFILATSSLDLRRMGRELDRLEIFTTTGRDPSLPLLVRWWVIDHLLFLWDLIWGFIEPILLLLLFGLFRIVVIILANVAFFGFIYWMLTT